MTSHLAGIGPLGTPELIIIGILLMALTVPAAVIVGIVIWKQAGKKPRDPAIPPPPPLPRDPGLGSGEET